MRLWIAAGMLATTTAMTAQTQLNDYVPGLNTEGAVYFLPKTEINIIVQVEKTTTTPGDFRHYSKRYLKVADVPLEKTVTHRVNAISMYTTGTADKSKAYSVKFHAKSSATNMELADDGVLLAINANKETVQTPARFQPAPKPKKVNPRQFLTQEILSTGSTAKMAELIAKEIYDIRESVKELTRGEADYMPKDGEQLRLMLAKLDEQDKALTGMFCGTTEKDTVEYLLTICPDKEIDRQVLFRLSQQMGMVDADDLSGAPFYISVKDLHTLPPVQVDSTATKKKKSFICKKSKDYESGIFVNVAGKVLVTIAQGNNELLTQEINTAQFGHTELLGAELFNKKYITRLVLNPITGAVDKFESETVEKK